MARKRGQCAASLLGGARAHDQVCAALFQNPEVRTVLSECEAFLRKGGKKREEVAGPLLENHGIEPGPHQPQREPLEDQRYAGWCQGVQAENG